METARKRRIIAIAGGGIAGLTAALFLERAGFRVQVFEKAPQLPVEGAGIQISPQAYKLLAKLGLERNLRMVGQTPERISIRSGTSGKHLANFELGTTILNRHGGPYLTIHRLDLAQILLAACEEREDIEIIYSHKITDLAAHANGVTLLAEHGGQYIEYQASAVIGADGVWSSLRRFVHEAAEPVYTGRMAWRALFNADTFSNTVQTNETSLWLGPNAHIVHYPVRQGQMINVVAITDAPYGETPPKRWENNSQSTHRENAFLNWHDDVRTIMEKKAKWGGWPIYAVPKPGAFANGPLCLIGDAAHAMEPYAAQGGACAIEDAAQLGSMCNTFRDDLPLAFQKFEKSRHKRISKIVGLAGKNRKIYHLPAPLCWGRNIGMKMMPQEALQKRMDWLYGWKLQQPKKPTQNLLNKATSMIGK